MQTLHPRDRLSGIASTVESFGSTFLQGNISGVNNCTPRKDSKNGSPEDSSGSFASLEEQQSQGGSPSSRRKKLQQFASRTKDATKRLLNTSDRQERLRNLPQEDDKSPNALTDDAAFNLNKLDTEHRSDKGIAKKIQVNVQSVAAGIVHPKKGIKGKATRSTAGRLSRIERPYLSKDMDLDLLDAHDNLSRVQSVSSSAGQSPRHDQDPWDHDQKGRVERLEGQRESLRAAYTTSRLVQRVRVVPKQHINFPRDEYFVKKNDQGQRTGYDWLKWIGYNLVFYTQDFSAQYIDDFDQLPFSKESLQQQVERLAMASAPWQAFFMDMRSVYRWEEPLITARWLALYVCLWYTQHLIGFIYAYVIYAVIRNRYFPSSVEALRKSIGRSHDQRRRAYKFGELVDKHGRHHWVEPLLEDLGPFIQLQLHDVANMLEVFANFRAWIYPRKTAFTLVFLASCLLITLLADMAFCMKIATFIVGGAFFICWPIASRYPQYRYLVSPFKWALWGIPTDTEWAFQYLRRNAQTTRERLIEQKAGWSFQKENDDDGMSTYNGHIQLVPDTFVNGEESDGNDEWHSASSTASILDQTDIMTYRGYSQGAIGRLIIYSAGIRFVRSVKRKELWRRSFLELAEMRKQEGSSSVSKLPAVSPQSLELKFIDGSKTAIEGMKDRDSAFNTIIGFSGLQWQSLQAKDVRRKHRQRHLIHS